MRKTLLIALAALVGMAALFLIVVALQPSEFHVVRSATMAASPEEVFQEVNDLRKWDAWSPWAKLDPNVKNTFAGANEGEGAIFRWSGNEKVGEGSMTIVESRPHELIRLKLEFVKPFEDKADVEFAFEPQDDGTQVTWSMSGENNFVGKVMCLFMDMDDMIGSQYEEGLANLKKIVEGDREGS